MFADHNSKAKMQIDRGWAAGAALTRTELPQHLRWLGDRGYVTNLGKNRLTERDVLFATSTNASGVGTPRGAEKVT